MKKRLVSFFAIVVLLVCTIVPSFAADTTSNECSLIVVDDSIDRIEVFVDYNYKELEFDSYTQIYYGDYFNVSATPSSKIDFLYYTWDGDLDNIQLVYKSSFNLQIPLDFEANSIHTLIVGACYGNDINSEQKRFHFVIVENDVFPTPEEVSKFSSYSSDFYEQVEFSDTLPINSHFAIKPKYRTGTCPYYFWDDLECIEVGSIKLNYRIEIPADFEVGSTHTLTLYTVDDEGNKTAPKVYTITFTEAVDEFAIDEDVHNEPDNSPDAMVAPVIDEELL